jgi:hypothetical protein
MFPHLQERVAYGRSIRERARCLLESHGTAAVSEALRAADEPGLAEADRSFWHAVAARVVRMLAQDEVVGAR